MKTRLQLLLIAVFAFFQAEAKYIFTEQMNIIPIAKGTGNEQLDSIFVLDQNDSVQYSLIPQYDSQGKIAEYVTGHVKIGDEYQNNTFMNIEILDLSNVKKEIKMTIVEDGIVSYIDSTIINYNQNGYELSAFKYKKEDGVISLSDSIHWFYPDMTFYYSVLNASDTVYYTKSADQLISAIVYTEAGMDKADFVYDNKGNLISTIHDQFSIDGIERDMEITFHWQPLITSVAKKGIDVSIFPNPTSSIMTVNSTHNCQVQIFTLAGQPVKRLNANCNEMINLAGMSRGYYIVKITDAFGGKETRRVLLQ